MAGTIRTALLAALLVFGIAKAQQVLVYTETEGELALGYPVPTPVESLTPVDGFRSYQSLEAQYDELLLSNDKMQESVVGLSAAGREIRAFQLSDADTQTAPGLPEPAILISGTVHAREWASPEVVTAIIEDLAENSDDAGIRQYLLENTNIVVVPIVNPDGLLQTQRYPALVVRGQDPDNSNRLRDGRMRRKNMYDAENMLPVDEDLFTFEDHLLGTDLNRQWPPFWGGGSSDPESITYRGTTDLDEPEVLALQAAGDLGPADRLRLYIDFHSRKRLFFVPETSNYRRNAITASLIEKLQAHLDAIDVLGFCSDYLGDHCYDAKFLTLEDLQQDSAGTTDEYFSDTFQIPSWTLEIEPRDDDGQEYGGFGAQSSGFILPESEIARVRNELTQNTLLALYHQAGPPSVQAVQVLDKASGQLIYAVAWETQAGPVRSLFIDLDETLQTGREYTLWVAFDKPMRWRDSGVVANFPGQTVTLAPQISLEGNGLIIPIDGADATWLTTPGGGPEGYVRYRDDAFTVDFTVPGELNVNGETSVTLSLTLMDFAGLQLDADPTTPVDWDNGAWSGYEDENGDAGDIGGTDSTIILQVSDLIFANGFE